MRKKSGSPGKKHRRKPAKVVEVQIRTAGQAVLTPRDVPPKPPAKKTIHERRFPPPVPERPEEDPNSGS
jgi:hypothetical protein